MKEVKRYGYPDALLRDRMVKFVLASDYDSLLRKFAEVELDAARYRWLRNRETIHVSANGTPSDLDAAIDKEMQQHKSALLP